MTVEIDDLGRIDGPMILGGIQESFLVYPDRADIV